MEIVTIEGDSPVCDSNRPPLISAFQSSTELVKLCVKLGGPPSKAKYYSTTNSLQVRRLKGEKDPFKGS